MRFYSVCPNCDPYRVQHSRPLQGATFATGTPTGSCEKSAFYVKSNQQIPPPQFGGRNDNLCERPGKWFCHRSGDLWRSRWVPPEEPRGGAGVRLLVLVSCTCKGVRGTTKPQVRRPVAIKPGAPRGIRILVLALRGPRPGPLDDGGLQVTILS